MTSSPSSSSSSTSTSTSTSIFSIAFKNEPWLKEHAQALQKRVDHFEQRKAHLLKSSKATSLCDFARTAYRTFGAHEQGSLVVLREWLPHAYKVALVGDFDGWKGEQYIGEKENEFGVWIIKISKGNYEEVNVKLY